uniref:Uncharacterized protein n=1 Tax=Picea sitchensis TaxID=3332 RepID=A9NLK1_PICSI|nr:unknown [Picea sitchensis]
MVSPSASSLAVYGKCITGVSNERPGSSMTCWTEGRSQLWWLKNKFIILAAYFKVHSKATLPNCYLANGRMH